MSVKTTDKVEAVACRGCLATDGKLYNMFDARLLEPYEDLVGYPVGTSDVYPKYLCMYCRSQLLNFQLFRVKCRRVLEILKDAQCAGYTLSTSYIRSIDRKYYRLNTNYTQLKTDIIECGPEINNTDVSVNNQSNSILLKYLSRKAATPKKYNENDIELYNYEEIANKNKHIDGKNTVNNVNNDRISPHVTEYTVDNNEEEDWRDEYLDINSDSDSEGNDSSVSKNNDNNDSANTKNTSKLDKKEATNDNHMMSKIIPVNFKDNAKDKKCNFSIDKKESTNKQDSDIEENTFDINEMKDSDPEIDDLIKLFLHSPTNYTKIVTEINETPIRKAHIAKKNNKRSKRNAKCEERNDTTHKKAKNAETYDEIPEKGANADVTVALNNQIKARAEALHFNVKFFTKEEQLDEVRKRREAIVEPPNTTKCEVCGEHFETVANMMTHYENHHNPNAQYICQICHYRFADKPKLAEHSKEHKYEFSCKDCEYVTRKRDKLPKHFNQWHREDNTDHICAYCGKVYNRISIHFHLKAKHPDELISCDLCNVSVSNSLMLKKHYMIAHKDVKEMKCHCDSMFLNEDALAKHQDSNRCDLYPCKLCGVNLTNEHQLKFHLNKHRMQYIMIEDYYHECYSCKVLFLNSEALETHLEVCRDGVFPCIHCGKSFGSRDSMKKHLGDVHASEENCFNLNMMTATCICDVCGKCFKAAQHLRHHKAVHTDGPRVKPSLQFEPSNCQICDKVFSNKLRLDHHMQVHSVERPFRCKYCTKTFKFRSGLNKHRMLHHEQNKHVCPICGKSFMRRCHRNSHVQEVHIKDRSRPDLGDMETSLHNVRYDTIENNEGSEYLVLAEDSNEETN